MGNCVAVAGGIGATFSVEQSRRMPAARGATVNMLRKCGKGCWRQNEFY